MYHEIITINDLTDREEILNTLGFIETDEDFNGHNGIEYCWDATIDGGFESNQEYVVDKLRKSDLKGEKLIRAFFEEWFDNDGYYGSWSFEGELIDNKRYVCSIVATHE